MEPNENETAAFEVPPATETPATWDETRPRYFGVTPHGLAAVIAAFAFGAGVVLLASGYVLAGVLLFVAAALLAAIFAEQARRRRDSAFDRIAAAAVDRTRALAGFTGSSVRAWTGAGRELARLRLEANRRAKERNQLQYALGGAVYAGDEAETARLREQMQAADARIAACVAEANEVVERMRATRAQEKLAVVATEIRGPTDGPTDAT
jgi:membrane protein implicated in regulation of membrane protease activity